ncbi:MAG TPA: DUF3631 domain-containing protein [Terriglobia bacterium]|nr:DUF3631 domain-containing protein [Terriglobia bacterium]
MNGSKVTAPEWGDIGADISSPAFLENVRVVREELPKEKPVHSTQEAWRKPKTEKLAKTAKALRVPQALPEDVELQAAREIDGEETIPSGSIVETAESFLRSYVVLPPGMYLPVALWGVGTYFTLFFEALAYIAVTGPTMRCGKSRVLDLLKLLSWRPKAVTSISESALFRMLAKSPGFPPPTLLLDEVESLRKAKDSRSDAINAILNSGYRAGQSVPRCAPKTFELEYFPTFGPKALACIGNLPATLQDRSIVIEMQRRAPNEPLNRFLFGQAQKESAILRNSLRRDMNERAPEVVKAYQAINDLTFLTDRDAEISIPLFAICRVFSPAREAELKATLVRVFGDKAGRTEDDNLNQRLLADLKLVWPDGEEKVSTAQLLGSLKAVEDSPWANGFELNPRKLARMLSGFGIQSRTVRIGLSTVKGYFRSEFESAWGRYLFLVKGPEKVTPSQALPILAANDAACDGVTDRSPSPREMKIGIESDPEKAGMREYEL